MPGERVVAANSAPCLQCLYCRRGRPNLCEDLLFNNGAYAEYMRIPARIVERNTYELAAHLELSGRRAGRAPRLRRQEVLKTPMFDRRITSQFIGAGPDRLHVCPSGEAAKARV